MRVGVNRGACGTGASVAAVVEIGLVGDSTTPDACMADMDDVPPRGPLRGPLRGVTDGPDGADGSGVAAVTVVTVPAGNGLGA